MSAAIDAIGVILLIIAAAFCVTGWAFNRFCDWLECRLPPIE